MRANHQKFVEVHLSIPKLCRKKEYDQATRGRRWSGVNVLRVDEEVLENLPLHIPFFDTGWDAVRECRVPGLKEIVQKEVGQPWKKAGRKLARKHGRWIERSKLKYTLENFVLDDDGKLSVEKKEKREKHDPEMEWIRFYEGKIYYWDKVWFELVVVPRNIFAHTSPFFECFVRNQHCGFYSYVHYLNFEKFCDFYAGKDMDFVRRSCDKKTIRRIMNGITPTEGNIKKLWKKHKKG